ncbi:MAG: Ig-like domain-containing protein [Bacteroidota bacterium]
MRRVLLFTLLLLNQIAFSQNGLEGVFVEKYYVSNIDDAKVTDGGYLKPGSTTYRIWVDMKPGYSLQAVYGVNGHPLKLATTTYFFNHATNGGCTANDVSRLKLAENTTMLDSWISVGAGSDADYGILKKEDTYNSFQNQNGILKNDSPEAGLPLTKSDGLLAGSPQRVVSFFGIDSTALRIFNNSTDTAAKGQAFITENGSWASFGGAFGLDTSNKVLIAQLTTDGQLSFELNIQLGTPYGSIENYYAKNPQGSELQIPDLIYPLVKNNLPTITWKSSPKSKSIKMYSAQKLTFLVSDKEDDIRKVEYYVNDLKQSELFSAPYTFTWNPQIEGNAKVYAVVYDYAGGKTKSDEYIFHISK